MEKAFLSLILVILILLTIFCLWWTLSSVELTAPVPEPREPSLEDLERGVEVDLGSEAGRGREVVRNPRNEEEFRRILEQAPPVRDGIFVEILERRRRYWPQVLGEIVRRKLSYFAPKLRELFQKESKKRVPDRHFQRQILKTLQLSGVKLSEQERRFLERKG
ncbi:MAG: hypothetical protein D6805_07935 [Planctomycetota bacterium]|nr:MAG: hypothetical protein D6805_07935 [Planctomycetota bacterium]